MQQEWEREYEKIKKKMILRYELCASEEKLALSKRRKLKVDPQKIKIKVMHQTHLKYLYYPKSMYE